MKTFLILSAFIGFTLSEKLDRTYLPPPGSKFSGGSPGAIDVPLEFPKETYPSGSRDNNFGQPEISIKTDSGVSNVSPEKYGDTTSAVPSFNGNSYGFPTTTTSHAFSQTTSYVPAAGSTIEPDISIDSEYPINNSINITNPGHLREKSLSFDHAGPNNIYNTIEEKQMLNDINNILGHTLPDNRMNSQEIKKIYDESQHSNDRHLNIIPKIISYHNDLGIPGKTATPSEMDHSLLNSNYDAHHNPPSSEPISQHDVNLISSTPVPTDHIYSKTPTKYVQTTPTNITSTPYSYRSRPERIQAQDRDAVILNYDNTITPEGYAYSFDTSNGIHADEEGIAINGVQAVGSYSYIGDDGQLYSVNYTADENGFRPYGAHLPTAPPIPDAILKVIEQAAVDKANGIYDDGSYDENKHGYQKYNPTKIIRFPNQYNQDREGTNLNKSKNNNKISHNSRLKEKFHKDNDTDKENKQNINTKNQVQPFIKNELFNESIHKLSPNYKSEHFETNGKDPIDSYNNKYENKLHNKILNSMPHLKDVKIDKIMNIESYDETGYHYTKPEKAADKLINRFSETPTTIKNPEMYIQIVKNVPVRPTFMTPYVSRNDDFFIENDDNNQSLDVPTKYHEEENVIISNAKNSPFPTMKQTKIVPGKTGNGIHNFNNQLKLSDKSPFDDQRYSYDQNVNSNNDSYVPYVYSTEIGLSDITSTIPTSFPSRFDSKESSNDNKSRNPSNYPESSLFQNQDSLSDPSLDQEKHQGPLTHLNQLDNYSNKNNDDITDSGFKYNTPNTYGAVKDYIMEHSTAKTYSEDFSGPKQAQKYDPLTGYHY